MTAYSTLMSQPRAVSSADPAGKLVLVRHGATEWSTAGRHTGRTDLPLLPEGEDQARLLAARLAAFHPADVVSSPRLRARRTAELAGFTPTIDDDLQEWDYGPIEGLTTAVVRARLGRPTWNIFTDGIPADEAAPPFEPGTAAESVAEITARADRVIGRYAAVLADGDVLVFAHGHFLRVLAARFLAQPAAFGGSLLLDAAAVCVLEIQRGMPSIRLWNAAAG